MVSGDKRVLLSSIRTITFFDGEKTAFRRTSPVPQLTCNGSACKLYRPDVVQCYNQGGSGTEIEWKCEADLPANLKLGRVEVGCEGWTGPDDPYILKGSCGLTYTLKKVDSYGRHEDPWSAGGLTSSAVFFWTVFGAVALFILYPLIRSILASLFPSLDRYLPGSSGGPGGGGGPGGPGGGGGGWGWGGSNRGGPRFWGGGRPSDPPPPYTPRQPPKSTTTNEPWRPGFWTGLAAGTAATHLFGNRQNRAHAPETAWAPLGGPSLGGFGNGGWFGGGVPVGRSHPTYRGQGSSRDMDDGDSLGPIRSSTGFGSTRNR